MFQGFYEICTKNMETGEVSVKHTQKNIITDYGLNYFSPNARTKTSNNYWSIDHCGVWLKNFDDPNPSLEELVVPYLTGNQDDELRDKFRHTTTMSDPHYNYTIYDDGKTYYMESTLTYTFRHKYIVGDIYGVYIGRFDSFGRGEYIYDSSPSTYPWTYDKKSSSGTHVYDHVFSIFSALKFKNNGGDNISIPVSEIEQLFIRYTVRQYFPKYARPSEGTFETEMGTTHKVTCEPIWWSDNYAGTDYSRTSVQKLSNNSNNHAHSVADLYYENTKEWDRYFSHSSYFSHGLDNYTPNSLTQSSWVHFDLRSGNGTIKHADLASTMGYARLTFDPPIEKNNERKLTLRMNWRWGRFDIDSSTQELVVKNPRFETDLSEWVLKDSSELVRNEFEGKGSIYLSGSSKIDSFSQILDLSENMMEHRRIGIFWEQKSKDAKVSSIKVEYMEETDDILTTQTFDKLSDSNAENFEKRYYLFRVPTEAVTAQRARVIFNLSTGRDSTSFIAISNITSTITDMTPIPQ